MLRTGPGWGGGKCPFAIIFTGLNIQQNPAAVEQASYYIFIKIREMQRDGINSEI